MDTNDGDDDVFSVQANKSGFNAYPIHRDGFHLEISC